MDIISSLPDFLLCHVLSFLPTKLAASTSVLSKRWQFLWIMVPNLDLEFEPHKLPKDKEEGLAIMSFVNFVNKIFTERHKDLSIKRFRLNFMSTSCKTHVDSWVLAAISSHVEYLNLDLGILECLRFCCSIFTCKTLVVLKLSHGIVIDASPSSIHFPSLKDLELWWINFENHDTFKNLISGCPVLENLRLLQHCKFEESSGYVISSPTLRKLVVYLDSTQLCVEAPSLESLSLEIHQYDDIYLNNLGSLVEAVVDLQIDDIDDVDTSPIVQDVLEALYNVQVLILDRSTLKGIDYGVNFECLPVFHNLVELNLGGYCCFWMKLVSLLHKAPILQHMTIGMEDSSCGPCYYYSDDDDDLSCDDTEGKLSCDDEKDELSRSDTKDELSCDYMEDALSGENMEFVKFVLKYSIVLENMTLSYWGSLNCFKKYELATLERGSKKCQLKLEEEIL